MKILYITVPSFFDLEISLIRELGKVCDVHVLMIVSPASMHSSAFDIDHLLPECALVKACEFEGMWKYASLIDLDRWTIANNPNNSWLLCFKLARKIIDYIKSEQFSLIHTTTSCKTSLFLLPYIRKIRHTLYTLHDPIPHSKLPIYERVLRRDIVFYCYENLLLLSNSLEQEFVKANKGKFKQLYYSQLSIYDFLHSFPLGNNNYGEYILFFGRIDRYKGVDLLIDAYKNTKAYKSNIKLIIAGKALSGMMPVYNDKQVVFINRYIPNDELATLISHCKFVVLPYRSATQSGCVFSAYAFNCPVLATNVGDLSKQVDNGVTGILMEPNSKECIIQGINRMLESDLEKMSMNIQSRYLNNGRESWSTIAEGLLEIYQKIIK